MAVGGYKHVTTFRTLAILVYSDIAKANRFDNYLDIMNKTSLTPDLVLKYGVLVHIYIQERSKINSDKLMTFLGRLLEACSKLI